MLVPVAGLLGLVAGAWVFRRRKVLIEQRRAALEAQRQTEVFRAIVDNLGDDEFSSYVTEGPGHLADVGRWREFGFDHEVIDTVFSFDDLEEACTLLGFFFGESGRVRPKLEVGFRVGLFHRPSRGA